MTFQSLLSQLNLKQLIPALKQLKTKPTLPYYVLKLQSDSFESPSDCALSITYNFIYIEKKYQTRLYPSTKVPSLPGAHTTYTELPKLGVIDLKSVSF